MTKSLHRILPVLAFSAVLLCGCVDHDYDLEGLDTDNITVGGELVMPLGKIGVQFDELLEMTGQTSLNIMIPGNVPAVPVHIGTPFDQSILDKLDNKTPITVVAEVTNCVSIPMLLSVEFQTSDRNVILLDGERIEGKSSGATTVKASLSMEQFRTVATASDLMVTLSTIDGQNKQGTITPDATLRLVLSVQKGGGIKL